MNSSVNVTSYNRCFPALRTEYVRLSDKLDKSANVCLRVSFDSTLSAYRDWLFTSYKCWWKKWL